MTAERPTISSLAESLLNPQGRFRTLAGICAVTDACGMPRFTVTSLTADFETEVDGTKCLLRAALGGCAPFGTPQPYLHPGKRQTAFIAPYEYLREELLAFGGTGRALRTDVVLERLPVGGMRLTDFVRTRLDGRGSGALRRLLAGFAEMYRTFDASGIVHGHLKPSGMFVTEKARPMTLGYLHGHRRSGQNDRMALTAMALLTYASACAPNLFHILWHGTAAGAAPLTALLTQAEFDRNDPLARAVATAMHAGGYAPKAIPPAYRRLPDSLETEALLDALSLMPFRPMPLLEELLAIRTPDIQSDTPRPLPPRRTPVAAENGPERLDAAACDCLAQAADTMIRYCKEGMWGFADTELHPLTEPIFLSAGDFCEGRAAVETPEGCGLIDRSGAYVMEPRFEALEWYGEWNAVAACLDGEWNLYDRCGRRLTACGYDWMAAPEEGTVLVRRGGRFGFIDTAGHPLTTLRYDEAFSFRDGRALVRTDGDCYVIDRNGKRIG